MKRVFVRNADGIEVEMLAVDKTETLVYVINPSSAKRYKNGLTSPVGVPKEDVFWPRPATGFLNTLTPEQRKMALDGTLEEPGGALIGDKKYLRTPADD